MTLLLFAATMMVASNVERGERVIRDVISNIEVAIVVDSRFLEKEAEICSL